MNSIYAANGVGNTLSQQQIRTVRQLITNDIAYYIQYSKRGGSSGGMMQNDEYQLFIDNNNILVYAANNQIIDGMASDYALKIEPNGLLTIKNLKVINFDFVAQINYAESGTVWMFDAAWYNSGDIVPDQVTPASDALPIVDGTAAAGISTEYSRGDHVHPLNITSTIPISDSASGSVGTANYYARSDHSHPINITTTISPQDSASGSVGTANYYARNDHSHPINVETNASNIPIVNGVGANGTSAFYARQDHVHPQQLTYDGNVTATKFIKTGGLATELLVANGNSTTDFVTKATAQTITGVKTFYNQITADGYKIPNGTSQQMLLANGSTKPLVLAEKDFYIAGSLQYIKLCMFSAFAELTDVSVEFTCNCRTGFGVIQFNQVYTSDGIGTYQYKLQSNMSYGMDVCYIIYFGTGADRYGELWARVLMWSNYLTFQQTNQSQETIPLSDVLTSEMQPQLPS
ncbi:MAG: hypothetical protein EZS28_021454, partial [Streblomastix strix]